MGFDIVRGFISKPQQTEILIQSISKYFEVADDKGTLYLGYPLTAGSDGKVSIDAMLVSENLGMISFIFANCNSSKDNLNDEQDALYYHLDFYLKKYKSLRQGRKTIVSPIVITIITDENEDLVSSDDYMFSLPENVSDTLLHLPKFDKRYYKELCEALQKSHKYTP